MQIDIVEGFFVLFCFSKNLFSKNLLIVFHITKYECHYISPKSDIRHFSVTKVVTFSCRKDPSR